ncbi:class III extradiol ring-cleavage dioxygenase [Pseudoxanthomonas sp. SL93]|uniref:dioxygenase family protein n=1 Tax=Pseudoxanthomonas sp. SL93 TaxID=2995142 RepID=UPI00226E5FE0|nr:class III extradiol ring-cleavage dioxygenase [Pseudoxanthomonas sp. SL93]WAC64793.1 class III extradiol ring-cleavage dioxygenase [Pseudoxanthomonas sp. SL93]
MDNTTALPSLFLSHGSPMLAVEDSPTGRFLDRLSGLLPRPSAIVVASAHFIHARPTVTATPSPGTIHDFGGFPPALYDIRYPATGAPALATDVAARLTAAGFDARLDDRHGLDHGVWVPLHRMYPAADLPVVALSVNPARGADWHYRLGLALAPLRAQGVLVIGSGGFSHNLRALDWQHGDAPAFPWVDTFTHALRERLLVGDIEGALDWQSLPEAQRNHPTPEHLYPLYVALGAGGVGARARLLHRDMEMGGLALDAFAFDNNT